jgi:hypothetical protein
MYQKYLWMFIDNVDDSYSQIWCMFVDSVWCVCCLWISCGWYCLCDDKYSICQHMISYVVTCGEKHIRRQFWPLLGLTSVGTYHSRRKLVHRNFHRLWYVPTEVSGLTSVSRQRLTEVTTLGVALTSVTVTGRRKLANFHQLISVGHILTGVSLNPQKLTNFRENCSISVSMWPTEVFWITVVSLDMQHVHIIMCHITFLTYYKSL